MNKFEKLNKGQKLFKIDVENPTFKKLNTFNDKDVLKVLGCYINKHSVFGDEPIFICQTVSKEIFFVNCPKGHIQTVEEIIKDSELVNAINNGECFIEVQKYFSQRFKKECFDFNFIENGFDVNHNSNNQVNTSNGNINSNNTFDDEPTEIF